MGDGEGPSDGRNSMKELPSEVPKNGTARSDVHIITDEQKARMEANRLKALERAAARARFQQSV